MKLPRDFSAEDLIKALSKLGYETMRQTGSHIRLTTQENGEHNLTIPAHLGFLQKDYLQKIGGL